jgi:type IV fimbrial biogenesis protein FimT
MYRRESDKYGFGNESGMTLIEILVVIGIMGILAGIGTVMLMRELPNIRLKEATRELFNDIQSTRMFAVRRGVTCVLQQLPGQANGYQLVQNGVVLKTVNLADFGGVSFGSLDASSPAPDSGTFTNDRLTIQPSGMANSGQFYLRSAAANQQGRRIDVNVLGRPSIRTWNGATYN